MFNTKNIRAAIKTANIPLLKEILAAEPKGGIRSSLAPTSSHQSIPPTSSKTFGLSSPPPFQLPESCAWCFRIDHSRYQKMLFLVTSIHRRPFAQQQLLGVQWLVGLRHRFSLKRLKPCAQKK